MSSGEDNSYKIQKAKVKLSVKVKLKDAAAFF